VCPNADPTAGSGDASFLESLGDPRERNVNRRVSMAGEPMTVDCSGMIVLSDRPGMRYEFDFIALAKTRAS
jgi:hypothetical protein